MKEDVWDCSDYDFSNNITGNFLVAKKYNQTLVRIPNSSFLSKKDAQFFLGDFKMVEIDNPISQDLSVMRPSLVPNLINYLSKNKRNGLFNNGIFEVSSIFSGENSDNQIISAAAIREGEIDPRHWSIEPRNVDIYDIKADFLEVLMSLGVNVNNIKLKINAPVYLTFEVICL